MNRIILIGNGFDLAHGLKTSYKNFIDDYWKSCINECNSLKVGADFENDFIKIKNRPIEPIHSNGYNELIKEVEKHSIQLTFRNYFLEIISKRSGLVNWVDIENEYYTLLKENLNSNLKKKEEQIISLNEDFEGIKNLLIEYLKNQEEIYNKDKGSNFEKIKDHISNKSFRPFEMRDFSENSLMAKVEMEYQLIKEDLDKLRENGSNKTVLNETDDKKRSLIDKLHSVKNPKAEMKRLLKSSNRSDLFDLVPDNILFLNFNYTSTDKLYQSSLKYSSYFRKKIANIESIHIHGTLDEIDENPVIFGFGDELDDDYKDIEKLNNNLFLENIKSINYLETDNYKRLLEYINSSPFQVFIYGHSCGTSDRTMLNTMFEHDNCASIKLFYHQKEDGQDNYSDVIRNISRNFNDKAKMRDRVVNKTYCEKLV